MGFGFEPIAGHSSPIAALRSLTSAVRKASALFLALRIAEERHRRACLLGDGSLRVANSPPFSAGGVQTLRVPAAVRYPTGDDVLWTGAKSFWIDAPSVMIRSAASDSQAAALPDSKAQL